MPFAALDIGAGSTEFARIFCRKNARLKTTFFCGEPEWRFSPFKLSQEKKLSVLRAGKRGIYKVQGTYRSFSFPEQSLDLVTLNAPHPFSLNALSGIGAELDRCLKPGGFFFSSFPRMDLGLVPNSFTLLHRGYWEKLGEIAALSVSNLVVPKLFFPQSNTIWANMYTHRFGNPHKYGSGYLYSDGIAPGYRLWQKPV